MEWAVSEECVVRAGVRRVTGMILLHQDFVPLRSVVSRSIDDLHAAPKRVQAQAHSRAVLRLAVFMYPMATVAEYERLKISPRPRKRTGKSGAQFRVCCDGPTFCSARWLQKHRSCQDDRRVRTYDNEDHRCLCVDRAHVANNTVVGKMARSEMKRLPCLHHKIPADHRQATWSRRIA